MPTIRDRLALAALKATLTEVYSFSGPEPPQRKIGRVIDAVGSGRYSQYLKVDIQDYFGSIRHQVVLDRLRRDVQSQAILSLTERALRNSIVAFGQKSRGLSSEPDGLPLGISISSLLAELYLHDFDMRFGKNFKLFRYVDDILVLTEDDRHPFALMHADLRHLGLSTHSMGTVGKCEVGNVSDGFEYLGYRLDGASVVVASAGIRKVESQLARLISYAGKLSRTPHSKRELERIGWQINLVIGGCVIDGAARGWIRYYNRIDSLTMLGRLDGLVDKLLRRYGLVGSIKVKRFRTAYWASRDNARFRRYAFDLDRVGPAEAREHLLKLEGWQKGAVTRLSDSEAQATFRRLVRRHVIDLERDLEPAS